MKIAVPVHNDTMKIFGNAGHTPYFAVFSIVGGGMFKSTKLEGLRANPRANAHQEGECEDEHTHKCHHEGEDAQAHKEDHRSMSQLLNDCQYLLVNKSCKNTKLVMEEAGIKVKKLPPVTTANEAITAFLKELA